ncbi:Cj0069 family protein [Caryophanon tenue]|uniref:DUF6815 domain-containing protein n=1 Tax=Caryophanon tenue TaxID=33978 RepID=A0A1C0YC58_9BACL|nr:Cj0069 family protein [Caryophanon tenue]OCS84725.1 hypothetical protein A6M13_03875 [Caryophanon tenue]
MKKVIFFEVRGGSDKGPDGFRPDTRPMIDALQKRGQAAEVLFFDEAFIDEIYAYTVAHAVAYVSRINPGNLQNEALYMAMLEKLSEQGIVGLSHPRTMKTYGDKEALVTLRHTPLVPTDTFLYTDAESFTHFLPTTLAVQDRVVKKNRGSTGEGVWRIQLEDTSLRQQTLIPLHARIHCTEAKDNQTTTMTLQAFIEQCTEQLYIQEASLIDMPYLPRVTEGELRVIMLNDKPLQIVKKEPAVQDAFSTTLFSGARYTYHEPNAYPALIQHLLDALPTMRTLLGYTLPFLWTADFILHTTPQQQTTYILSELNCSCVGFTSHLELAQPIAEAIIETISVRV